MNGFENGDFNYDGKINADDYFLIDENYAKHGAAFVDVPGSGSIRDRGSNGGSYSSA